MSINVDWEKLRGVYQELVANSGLTDETDIVFIMVLTNGKAKKSIVKFKDFMAFFWAISESKELSVLTLVAQDKDGRILYRYKQRTNGDEEVPDGGHSSVIQNWSALTQTEKETYLIMLLAQIQGYEQ